MRVGLSPSLEGFAVASPGGGHTTKKVALDQVGSPISRGAEAIKMGI
jgi:hypothetical protein